MRSRDALRIPVAKIVDAVTRNELLRGTVGVAWSAITGKPTTLAGYGITDGVSTSRTIATTAPLTGGGDLSADRTLAVSTMTGDSGSGGARGVVPAPAAGDAAAGKFLKADATWAVPGGGGSTTLTGDVTGSGTGTIATTLATVTSAATKGSATKTVTATVNAKGLVTALSEQTVTPAWGDVTGIPSSVSSLGSATVAPGRLLQVQSGAPTWRMPTWAQILYGGGEDGALTVDGAASIVVGSSTIAPVGGVYTLTADIDATTITMSGTSAIRTAGFKIRCWKLIGVAGNLIHDNGNAASGTTAGAGLAAAGTLRRTSGAGGAGRTTVGIGSAGTGQSNTWGGAGGNGGGGSPGTPGVATRPAATAGRNRGGFNMLAGWIQTTSDATAQAVSGGGGGSSGSNSSGAGTNSGSGGSGGGRVLVFAYECDYAGTVSANGGDGSAATGAGSAGGGGGGGGGEVVFVTEHLTSTPTLTAAGGAAGASVGGSAAATAGSAGTTRIYSPEA